MDVASLLARKNSYVSWRGASLASGDSVGSSTDSTYIVKSLSLTITSQSIGWSGAMLRTLSSKQGCMVFLGIGGVCSWVQG